LYRAHDEDGNGRVSFGEFLVSVNVATRGSAEDKLRWAFRMYDVDDDGTVSRREIVGILKVRAGRLRDGRNRRSQRRSSSARPVARLFTRGKRRRDYRRNYRRSRRRNRSRR